MRSRKPSLLRVRLTLIPDENPDGGRARLQTRFSADSGSSQLRFAGSGLHSPPRWRVSQAPMRSVPAARARQGFTEFRARLYIREPSVTITAEPLGSPYTQGK
jgi:hypothetical protein